MLRFSILILLLFSGPMALADDNLADAAKRGGPEDHFVYAADLTAGGRHIEAARWYERAAKRSHAGAQLALANAHLEGRGVREDPEKAVKWLKRAAKAGLAEAQYLLGMQYQEGNGVGHSTKDAARWLRAAADADHPGAQLRAGLMALNGVGMPRDQKQGIRWLTLAAEGGDEAAQLNMGLMQLAGSAGLGKDDAAAARWMHLAAEHGNGTALYNLGAFYARGTGVEQDFVEAWKWFELARLKGDASAETARDQVAKGLTPAGRKHAGQLVDAWLGARR